MKFPKMMLTTFLLSSIIYIIIIREVKSNIFIKTGVALIVAGIVVSYLTYSLHKEDKNTNQKRNRKYIPRKYSILSISLVVISTTLVGIIKDIQISLILVLDIAQVMGMLYGSVLNLLLFRAVGVDITVREILYINAVAYGVYTLTPPMALINFPIEVVKFFDILFVCLQTILYNTFSKWSNYRVSFVLYTTQALTNLIVGLIILANIK